MSFTGIDFISDWKRPFAVNRCSKPDWSNRSFKPQAKSAGDHHALWAMRQRKIARDSAQAEAEAVERGQGQAVAIVQCEAPDLLVVELLQRTPLDLAQRLIDRDDAGAGDDPFD